jgi:hypothetical protein
MARLGMPFSLFFLYCISTQLVAMDGTGTATIFDNRSEQIQKTIKDVQKGGSIYLETPFFSDDKIQKDLIKAAEKGVDVELQVASRAKADIEKLQKSGIKVTIVPNLHAKRLLCEDEKTNAETGEKSKRFSVFVGSDNLTVFSKFHKEMLLKNTGDKDYYMQHRAVGSHNNACDVKSILKNTPKKTKVYSSKEYDLNDSKAERIKRLFEDTHEGDCADITSMTFDSEDFVKIVEESFAQCDEADTKPTLRLIFDKSALKHKDLLHRIKKSAGDNAKIYIFNKDGSKKIFNKFPTLQHRKVITRQHNKKKLAVVSTGNLANKSNEDFNIDSYHPNDATLYDAIQASNDELVKECDEYTLSPSKSPIKKRKKDVV